MVVSREIPLGSSQPFQSGDMLGGYLIERLIGVGGMADVYLARHNKLDKEVAIKVLHAHARDRSDLRTRFLREGKAASRIRNPHVVEVFDVGTDGEIPYLVMQYLPGPTLEEHLAERGPLEIADAVHIFLPICAAVAAGHDEGVIHRDLKPENVILAIEGHRTRPTVLDFGVSRLVTSDPRLTLDSSVVGTPHYMSPEQARGEAIDSKTDQYAVGVMLYQAVTGRLPRDRASVLELLNEVGHKGFDPPSEHRASIPREFESVILQAMAQSRRDRFVTMYELAAALLPFASPSAQSFWAEELGIKPLDQDSAQIRAPHARSEMPTLAKQIDVPKPLPDLPAPNPRESEPKASPASSPRPSERTPDRPSRGKWIAAALLLLAVGAAAVFFLLPAGSERYVVHLRAEPSNATIEIDGEVVGQNQATMSFDADGTVHRLRVTAPDFEAHEATFRDAPPPELVTLRAATPFESEVDVAPAVPDSTVAVDTPTEEDEPREEPSPSEGSSSDSSARAGRARRDPPSREPARPPSAAEPEVPAASAPQPAERPSGGEWERPDLTENLDPWTD